MTNKGFTIICNKCSRKIIKEETEANSDSEINILPADYDGTIEITCKCGNEITIA